MGSEAYHALMYEKPKIWVLQGKLAVSVDGITLWDRTASSVEGTVRLSKLQSRLMRILMLRPLSSRNEVIEYIYPMPDTSPGDADNTLGVHILLLRKKLKPLGYTVSRLSNGRGMSIFGQGIIRLGDKDVV